MTVKKLIELLDEYKRLTHQILEDKRVVLNWNENHYGITLFSCSFQDIILFAEKSPVWRGRPRPCLPKGNFFVCFPNRHGRGRPRQEGDEAFLIRNW